MRCCQYFLKLQAIYYCLNRQIIPAWFPRKSSVLEYKLYYFVSLIQAWRCIPAISHHVSMFLSIKQHANLCPRSLHINFRLSPYPAKSHRLVGCFNSKSYNTAHICHFVFSTPPDRITNTLCKIATLPFRSVQCCIFTQGITIPVVL